MIQNTANKLRAIQTAQAISGEGFWKWSKGDECLVVLPEDPGDEWPETPGLSVMQRAWLGLLSKTDYSKPVVVEDIGRDREGMRYANVSRGPAVLLSWLRLVKP